MKNSNIGGQAVMEGIMMKNKSQYAIAVRKPDQEIEIKVFDDKTANAVVQKIPIIRGVVNFVQSLVTGMKSLTFSASFFEDEEDDGKEISEKKQKALMAGTVALSIVMALGLFMVAPYLVSLLFGRWIKSLTWLTILEGVTRLTIFFGYIFAISRMKEIRRVFMYHGAEHKCINCIEQGLELNVENVRKCSRLHKRCGTSFLLIVMVISVIFFLFIQVSSPMLRLAIRLVLVPVIAGVSYEFIKLAGKTENKVVTFFSVPGMLLQKVTTDEPDDDMIEVGIAAVEAVFDWRKFQEEEFGK